MNWLLVVSLLTVVPQSVIGLPRRVNVIRLDSYKCKLRASIARTNAKSRITINIIAGIASQSDTINGANLWRLGIYGSNNTDANGEKVGFRDQILTPKQASKQPRKGKPLKLKNVLARFDLNQIACGELRYFCVEFAKNPDSTVDFELRWGRTSDSIVVCKEWQLECRRPNANARVEAGSYSGNSLVEGRPPADDKKILVFNRLEITWSPSIFRPNEISMAVSFYVCPGSDEIEGGKNLWTVGVYGSRYENGEEEDEMLNFKQVLDKSDSFHWPDIRRSSTLVFPPMSFQYDDSAIGCGEYQYLCVLIAKKPNSKPDFEIIIDNGHKRNITLCGRWACTSE